MDPVLDRFTLPICLSLPHRETRIASWKEHIPFAMNLIAAIRPGTLIELGTHAGDSYCAFCQAVAETGGATRCYAVDTWQGDPQAGFYGPEVLADLRQHHDPLYGRFSTLIQSTFDEALTHFADGSVDLLHIDGLHSYEAVKHDFEAWLPKLGGSGVVLMHDVNVRERDFGVGRLWDELKARFPYFEFLHGHGLGVLAVGGRPPEALSPLLDATPEETNAIRTFFFALGRRIAFEAEVASDRARLGKALTAAVSKAERSERELAAAGERAGRAEARVQELEAKASALASRVDSVTQEKTVHERELAALRSALQEESARLDRVTRTVAWRAAARYSRARDRLLVPGTFRRRVFDRAVRVLTGKGLAAGAGLPDTAQLH
ncbi:MAG: hypothetical protein A2V77_06785 [Anaeromyxobacter sp. RBG_16_69_14]|nr:MAG: hypothetical protein A2V77_06785 [Anaeromyxobacter sp. RBG_16_69_14]